MTLIAHYIASSAPQAASMETLTAGACFFEPQEGDLRLVWRTLTHYLPRDNRADGMSNVDLGGVMVQEYGPRYSDDGFALCGGGRWENICPLADYPDRSPERVKDLPNLRADFFADCAEAV